MMPTHRWATSVDAGLCGRKADLPEVLRGRRWDVQEAVPRTRRQLVMSLLLREMGIILGRVTLRLNGILNAVSNLAAVYNQYGHCKNKVY